MGVYVKLEQGAKAEASKVKTKLEGDIKKPDANLNQDAAVDKKVQSAIVVKELEVAGMKS